jgi:mannobiose 2-epimerase
MRRIATDQLEFWLEHGPDHENGGFHGQLDRRGQPIGTGEKGLIQHARHLWSFSTWYERRESSPRIATIARNLYEYLTTHFSDRSTGGFFRKIDRGGNVTEPVHQVYPESFAVYALATYGRVFGDPKAIAMALRCFRSFDKRAHEPRYGGYDVTGDPPWQTPGANKETNTHIHVMEALTALGAVCLEPLVHQRLREFTELTITKLRQPANYAHLEFLMDYTPLGDPIVSYGHDLETSWLVTDALRVLQAKAIAEALPAATRDRALEMGKASALAGFDAQEGGYFNRGIPGHAVLDREKIWWVQFEALPALVQLQQATVLPDALLRLERTLDWLEHSQVDREFGGVYWGILPDGTLGPHGDIKGNPWKASYHELRGLIFAADWLEHGGIDL